ncbi:probable cellulose synthase A catalytic subunit 8 [UDP-forming] [Asparagus officinalis]|nr:probable cellulose synthase A catalytic subunit 8 [UDP-forming] [Asparagus officinalis]XP_020258044.1 probable cellulose synthase A catalytic subunit 8 [UDP-forming] [Asparagus officinalis]
MEVDGEIGKHGKITGAQQVCQICGDGVGSNADGELFVACDVCGFPVCRPCYEYERKDGNQSCPQCKTKYKRRKGSPVIRGEEGDDGDDDDVSDYNYPSGGKDQKQKIAERILLSWRTNYGRGEDIGPPKYDSGEIPRNHIPLLTHSQPVSGELPGASPDMSPAGGAGGKRVHPLPYVNHSPNPSREFSGGFGNVAWKERVDGWKTKQEKNGIPMTNATSHPPSEGRGVGDIDATTDYNMDDALL